MWKNRMGPMWVLARFSKLHVGPSRVTIGGSFLGLHNSEPRSNPSEKSRRALVTFILLYFITFILIIIVSFFSNFIIILKIGILVGSIVASN